jgi:hypothetical protein
MTSELTLAQNARFSQIWSTPAHFNPALTGRFDGKLKVASTYSWQRADSGNINHSNVSIDIKLGKYKSSGDEATGQTKISKKQAQNIAGKEAKDQVFDLKTKAGYWAAGLNYYRYGNTNCPIDAKFLALSVARHFYSRSNRMYGIGAQVAYANGNLDENRGTSLEKEISGGGFRYPVSSKDRNNISNPIKSSMSYLDFNVGAYYAMNSELVMFEIGASMHHLTAPVIDITKTDAESRLRRRITAHANFRLKMNEKWGAVMRNMYWKEGLYYRSRSYKDSLEIVSFWSGLELYKVNPAKKYNINYGLYTRSFKTFMPYLNINFDNWGNLRYTHEQPFNSKQFRAYNAVRDEISFIYTLGRNTSPGTRFYKKMQYW